LSPRARGAARPSKAASVALALRSAASSRRHLPRGNGLAWLDRDAFEPLWKTGVYHNALGRPNRPEKFVRILWAAAIRDASAGLAAVAGAWEESFLPACSFSIVRRVDPVTGSR